MPLAVLALILAFMTFGKVLSPQYFIWILPAIALVIPERRALGLLLIGALVLTQIEFPANYWSFVYLDRGAVLLVVARDAVLCVAFALSLWHLWRAARRDAGYGRDADGGRDKGDSAARAIAQEGRQRLATVSAGTGEPQSPSGLKPRGRREWPRSERPGPGPRTCVGTRRRAP